MRFQKNNYCTPETHLATKECICISMWFSKRFRIAVFLRENHVGAQATYTFYNESYMICTTNNRKISNQNTFLKLFPFNTASSVCPCGGVQRFLQTTSSRTQMRERQLAPTVVNFNSTMDACAKGASPQSLGLIFDVADVMNSPFEHLPKPPCNVSCRSCVIRGLHKRNP